MRALGYYIQKIIYWRPGGYNAYNYWDKRFRKTGFNLQSVGQGGESLDQNAEEYSRARRHFLNYCKSKGISFRGKKILEIGCGVGFYTKIMHSLGVQDYTGLDITDAFFSDLKKLFKGYQFVKAEITSGKLDEEYDIILMIDVTQHIVNRSKFINALKTIRNHLRKNGWFIVTFHPVAKTRKTSFYEVEWSLEEYRKVFRKDFYASPIKFRKKSWSRS